MKTLKKSTILALLLSTTCLTAGDNSATDLLANGDLSEWTMVKGEPVGDGWAINNGVVMCKGLHTGDIITKEHYSDFDLSFDWKISEGGNSGVKYRTRGNLGLEYQVLDDARHSDGEKPNHRTASLYDLVEAPDDKPVKPVGKWNSSRIVVKGDNVEHYLNGKKLLEVKIGSAEWKKRFANSKYTKHEGFGTWTGPILLQDHGDKVWYRNIHVKRL